MKAQYKLTFLRYLLTLGLLLLTQVIFYLLNTELFNVDSFNAFLRICWGNIKFALSTLSFYLATFLFFALVPLPFKNKRAYRIAVSILYFVATEFIMVANLIDCGYFRFTFKRITFDIFNYLGVGGDFNSLIPTFLKDYWHIVLIFIVLNFVLYWTDSRLRKKYYSEDMVPYGISGYAKGTAALLAIAFVMVIFQRGGFQKRAMNPIQASNYATTMNTALVLNTPYTFYRTIGKSELEQKNYFADSQLDAVFTPVNSPNADIWTDTLFVSPLQTGKTNVMIIIIESMSAEYTGIYNQSIETYTPFLDSLAQHSIVFNGMSNGKKSIDGIPAITASMPLLNETPYITSSYGGNKLESIASILKKEGYQTAFFHGGYNGTMNFDGFAHQVGYDEYYGMNEYNNNKDYDGNWGIFDEPFLQYTVKKINQIRQPFITTLFTLSNHSPYTIPPQHTGHFPKGNLCYHETVGYTDFALRRFFQAASQQDWFNNTLFVITADHSALNQTKEFKTALGLYRIPVIIYSPMLKHGQRTDITMQQIDILPTLNDMLHTGKPVFAYGKSIFSDKHDYYIFYSNGEYILQSGDYVSKYRDGFATELFNVKTDPDMKINIAKKYPSVTEKHKRLTQAIIQQYNNRLIKNKTTLQ
ncbi:MAG: sulfatase-like hydrolase/transferase [Bacteroidales bacterium]|nr:sulfatase-like hydrolase/transferase [Bacteroidales bacterium]